MALIGVRRALLRRKNTLVGPPTFVFQQQVGTASSTATTSTSTAMTVTATTASTRVYFVVIGLSSVSYTAISSATIGGIACDVISFAGKLGTTAFVAVVSATGFTPGTTSLTAVVTYNGNPSSSSIRYYGYVVDNTTMVSPTPTSGFGSTASGTTCSAPLVTQANGSVIAGYGGFGISNGTQAMTADSTITQNGSFSSYAGGVANNVPASAAYNVTETWTTTASGALGTFAFR